MGFNVKMHLNGISYFASGALKRAQESGHLESTLPDDGACGGCDEYQDNGEALDSDQSYSNNSDCDSDSEQNCIKTSDQLNQLSLENEIPANKSEERENFNDS